MKLWLSILTAAVVALYAAAGVGGYYGYQKYQEISGVVALTKKLTKPARSGWWPL